MKVLLISIGSLLLSQYGFAQTGTKAMTLEAQRKEKIALACKLTDKAQIKRMNKLHQTIFKKVDRVVEHTTSCELVFQQADSTLNRELAEFITFERLCCPWLTFQLTFQPEEGPVLLKMGDSAETKEMAKLVMELDRIMPKRH